MCGDRRPSLEPDVVPLLPPGSTRRHPVPVSKLHPEELGVVGRLLQRCGGGRGPVRGGLPGSAGGQRRAVEAGLPVSQGPRRRREGPGGAREVRKRRRDPAFVPLVFISDGRGEEVGQQPSSPSSSSPTPGEGQDCQIHSPLQRLGLPGHHLNSRHGTTAGLPPCNV